MRILVVAPYFDSHVSGLDIAAGWIARGLSRTHEVVWAAADCFPPRSTAAARPLPLPALNVLEEWAGFPLPLVSPFSLSRLADAVRQSNVVLVHNVTSIQTLFAAHACGLYARPLVLAQHGGHPHGPRSLGKWLFRGVLRSVVPAMMRRAACVVVSGAATKRAFLGADQSLHTVLVHNGVDADAFALDNAARADARRRFHLPLDAPVVLFVGRFIEEKGVHVFRTLAKRRPEIHWAFAGDGPVNPRQWSLPNIHTFGVLRFETLAQLYCATDLFLLPSEREGFPLVIKEALSAGLPIICSLDVVDADPELRTFVTQCPQHGSRDYDEEILELVDAALARGSGSAEARAERQNFARRRYSWERCVAEYDRICREVLSHADT